MFARTVSMHLKPNSRTEFTQLLESNVIPTLRKQKGFQDEITLIGSDGTKVTAISLWDSKEDAETYNRAAYPEVLKALMKVVEGTPEIRTSDVANSTFHKIAARVAA
jgi:heme-degrading monooxygenase HmoA